MAFWRKQKAEPSLAEIQNNVERNLCWFRQLDPCERAWASFGIRCIIADMAQSVRA